MYYAIDHIMFGVYLQKVLPTLMILSSCDCFIFRVITKAAANGSNDEVVYSQTQEKTGNHTRMLYARNK